jgi:putative heme-binding domain-containing protein
MVAILPDPRAADRWQRRRLKRISPMLHILRSLFALAAILIASSAIAPIARAADGEAEWIWSPAQKRNEIPVGDCYFRKSFDVTNAEAAEIHLTADNEFELFVNGQHVAKGTDWRQLQVHDITNLLQNGRNTVAVRVRNNDAGAAGLAARVIVKQVGGTFEGFSTDKSWRTSVREFANWNVPQFNDRDWVAAASYGQLGDALPWGNEIVIEGIGARFIVDKEFDVERIMRDDEVGSLIAMTFDSRGNIFASQEGGHLKLLTDSDGNGIHDKATTFCDKIQNAQGLLAIGLRLFVVGDGPEGMGLYRLRDADRNGEADEIVKLLSFKGSKGEHGAHGLRLGPDGLIYVIVGNFTRADGTPTSRSPYRLWYEGDLILPKYEDPGGHAVGIPSPGGTIFRTDANGSFVEYIAGGLRNAYDFAFDLDGELFSYDADMEWDRGAPWYRPTRVNHIPAGAELGWRSGWSKWPEYYLDSLPAAVDIGPGSPTGVEFYDHYAYPAKYQGAMFGCDWATGKIHAITFQRDGASYVGKSEVFLEGRPLNATDCAVGPDGSLYFCTGGRGTDGGVYRVRCNVPVPPALSDMGEGIDRALRQPQIDADWARAKAAGVRQALGDRWDSELHKVALNSDRIVRERARAIDLLVYFGPRPSDQLLVKLASDVEPAIRAKAARLMYVSDDAGVRSTLTGLLQDGDPLVRRCACESLMRRGPLPSAEDILPLLGDDDRFTAFAARRVIEQLPVDSWRAAVMKETNPSAFCTGATALVNVERKPAVSQAVLQRSMTMLADESITELDRVNLLRVVELALFHGKLDGKSAPELAPALLAMYPTNEPAANRELVRLLTFLQVDGAAAKFAAELAKPDLPTEEKLHIAAYASRLNAGWNTAAKLELLKFYEQARTVQGGYSVDKYVEHFTREYLKNLSMAERQHLIAGGDKWPASALSTLASLPANPGAEVLATIRDLDSRIAPKCAESDLYRRLRVGVIAVLGANVDPNSQAYLRSIYQNEPEYRAPVAISLTQHPTGENWKVLVDSLKTIEGPMAQEVLGALARVNQRPADATPFRDAILLGLKLGANGGADASKLLAHWTGQSGSDMATWQRWYAAKFPDAPPAELPGDAGRDKWSYEELLTFLNSEPGKKGDASRGGQVFVQAQCASCHRVGSSGETMGPDLTNAARRFQRKEILESIVYPSHVISDQYATQVVVAGGKSYAGIVSQAGDGTVTILTSAGQKIEVARDEVDEIQPSETSAMPTGLLNPLTLEQVADLFAYLNAASSSDLARRPATTK